MKRYEWKRGAINSFAGPCSDCGAVRCRALVVVRERIRVHALWLKREQRKEER